MSLISYLYLSSASAYEIVLSEQKGKIPARDNFENK